MDGTAVKRSVTALVAAVALVAAEMLRMSGPLLDQIAGIGGVPTAAAVAVVVFSVPALGGPLARWLGPARVATGVVLALVGLRLAIQIQSVPVFLTGVLAVAVAVLALAYVIWQAVAATPAGGLYATVGLILGGVGDVTIRAVFMTWDPVWQQGLWGYVVAIVECLFLLWALAGARHHFAVTGPPAARIAVVGPALALSLLVLASPAYVASQADIGVPTACAVLLAGALLAVETVSRLRLLGGSGRLPEPDGPAAGSLAALGLVAAVAAARFLSGPLVALAVVVGQIMLAVLLARALTPARTSDAPRAGGLTLAGLGAGLGFVLVALPYQAHYEMPLPFPNVVLLLLAAAVIGAAGLGRRPGPEPAAAAEPSGDTTASAQQPDRDQKTLDAAPATASSKNSRDVEVDERAVRRGRLAPLAAVPAMALAVPVVMLALTPTPLAPAAAGDAVSGQQFRLMSWNVHYGVDGDAAVALDDIATAIERQRPDVVTLQEISRGWPIGGGVDEAEWLSRRLRMGYVWSPAADGQFGNVIMSRLPMSDVDTGKLPQGAGSMVRSYAAATVELSGGGKVRVMTTHLQHRDNTPTRLAQLDGVLKAWDRTLPTVVTGDFNAVPGWPEIVKMTDAGFVSAQDQAGQASLPTSSTRRPRHRIDWIFGTPDLSFADFVRPDVRTSDHFPLAATIRLG